MNYAQKSIREKIIAIYKGGDIFPELSKVQGFIESKEKIQKAVDNITLDIEAHLPKDGVARISENSTYKLECIDVKTKAMKITLSNDIVVGTIPNDLVKSFNSNITNLDGVEIYAEFTKLLDIVINEVTPDRDSVKTSIEVEILEVKEKKPKDGRRKPTSRKVKLRYTFTSVEL